MYDPSFPPMFNDPKSQDCVCGYENTQHTDTDTVARHVM